MGRLRLADVLTDFGASPHRIELIEPAPAPILLPEMPAEPRLPDPADLVAEAVRQAEAALAAHLHEAHDAELSALRASHAEEMSAAIRKAGVETGAAIAAALSKAEERVLQVTTEAVARLLAPVLEEDVRQRSLEALVRAIRDALSDRAATRIRVRGPRELFDGLVEALGERMPAAEFEEAAGFDLTVAIDDELYETRLGEWSAGLSEALR